MKKEASLVLPPPDDAYNLYLFSRKNNLSSSLLFCTTMMLIISNVKKKKFCNSKTLTQKWSSAKGHSTNLVSFLPFSHSHWGNVNTNTTSVLEVSLWLQSSTRWQLRERKRSLDLGWSRNMESCAHSLTTGDVTVRESSWENCQPSYLLTVVFPSIFGYWTVDYASKENSTVTYCITTHTLATGKGFWILLIIMYDMTGNIYNVMNIENRE